MAGVDRPDLVDEVLQRRARHEEAGEQREILAAEGRGQDTRLGRARHQSAETDGLVRLGLRLGVGPDRLRAAMRADVVECARLFVLAAHHQQRGLEHLYLAPHERAGGGQFAQMAHVEPSPAEHRLALQIEPRRIVAGCGRNGRGAEERERIRRHAGERLGGGDGCVHGFLLPRFSRARRGKCKTAPQIDRGGGLHPRGCDGGSSPRRCRLTPTAGPAHCKDAVLRQSTSSARCPAASPSRGIGGHARHE